MSTAYLCLKSLFSDSPKPHVEWVPIVDRSGNVMNAVEDALRQSSPDYEKVQRISKMLNVSFALRTYLILPIAEFAGCPATRAERGHGEVEEPEASDQWRNVSAPPVVVTTILVLSFSYEHYIS